MVTKNLVTRVNGSSTAKSMNDYKSQYDSGLIFTVNLDGVVDPQNLAVIVCIADAVSGDVSMTVKEGQSVVGTGTAVLPYDINLVNTVGYTGIGYVVAYLNNTSYSPTLTLDFSNPGNNPVKVSKIIVGNYWSPKYNTNYGAQVGITDLSTVERLQGGDQYAVVGPRYKNMRFDLQYVDESDRNTIFQIAKNVGRSNPIFVSLFPNDSDGHKRQMYSIVGRVVTPPNMTNTMYSMYATSLEIEEI